MAVDHERALATFAHHPVEETLRVFERLLGPQAPHVAGVLGRLDGIRRVGSGIEGERRGPRGLGRGARRRARQDTDLGDVQGRAERAEHHAHLALARRLHDTPFAPEARDPDRRAGHELRFAGAARFRRRRCGGTREHAAGGDRRRDLGERLPGARQVLGAHAAPPDVSLSLLDLLPSSAGGIDHLDRLPGGLLVIARPSALELVLGGTPRVRRSFALGPRPDGLLFGAPTGKGELDDGVLERDGTDPEQRPGPSDHGAGDAEARRNRERHGGARNACRQHEAGRHSADVEADRCVDESGVGGGRLLERRIVRRDGAGRATLAERFDDRAGQRCPLVRVGARRDLVEQDEIAPAGRTQDAPEVGEVGAEGRQRQRQALIVADVREDVAEDTDFSLVGRDRQARPYHQGDDARSLEGNRLATGIRAGDDERVPGLEIDVVGHDGSAAIEDEQGVAHRWQVNARLVRETGTPRLEVPRQTRDSEENVEGRGDRRDARSGVRDAADLGRKLGQDAGLLALGVRARHLEAVPHPDDRAGLDEDGRAADGRAVNDARHPLVRVGADR